MRGLVTAARPILADLGGTLAFYLIYLATGSARLGAAIGLAVSVGQLVALRVRRRPVPGLLLMGLALTLVLGSLTFVTRDARFLMFKPTIIYACLGLTMLQPGWLGRYFPEVVRTTLPRAAIDRAGWTWAGLMFGTALLNAGLVLTLAPRTAAGALATWAAASKIALFLGQYATIRRRVRRLRAEAGEASGAR